MDMFSYLLGRASGGGGKGALKVEVVQELPEVGEANILYLVPRQVSETNNVFDEYLYVNNAWELIGTTDIDISGKQDKMQFATMPTANADNLGKIYQYIGTTNANYTNGYFYVCVSDGGNPATYSWANISVQDSGSSDYDIRVICAKNTPTQDDLADASKLINDLYYIANNGDLSDTKIVIISTNPSGYAKLHETIPSAYSLKQKYNSYSFYATAVHKYNDSSNKWNGATELKISGSWSNNVFTASGIVVYGNTGNEVVVLSIDNTKAYTPTSDYHPATKKYVDDSIASAITTTLGGNY